MKQLSIFLTLVLSIIFTGMASAQALAVPGYTIATVQISNKLSTTENIVAVRTGTDMALVKFDGCSVRWNAGDMFYMIGQARMGVILTRKDTFDARLVTTGGDFEKAGSAAITANEICIVQDMKPLK